MIFDLIKISASEMIELMGMQYILSELKSSYPEPVCYREIRESAMMNRCARRLGVERHILLSKLYTRLENDDLVYKIFQNKHKFVCLLKNPPPKVE